MRVGAPNSGAVRNRSNRTEGIRWSVLLSSWPWLTAARPSPPTSARAGFDALTDSETALASLTDGGRIDLAVIDCDLPAETAQKLYAAVHGDKPIPTLLLFGDEIPEFATTSTATRDEYAVKPIRATRWFIACRRC